MHGFQSRRIVRSYVQKIEAPAEKVFPLICPVQEAQWLDGFTYNMVYSSSGFAEDGCVFMTHHDGEPETTWMITQHDKERGVVEFVRVTPGYVVTRLRVTLSACADGPTAAHIMYEFTTLSEAGNRILETRHSKKGFHDMVTWWEKSLNHFLATGKQLKNEHSER